MTIWTVVLTRPGWEGRVIEAMGHQKAKAYATMERVYVGVGRRRRDKERPLFPGYVFADLGGALQLAHEIEGTAGPLMFAGKIAVVGDDLVAALKAAEAAGKYDKVGTVRPIERGERVAIVGGPFCGFTGKVAKLGRNRRVQVLVDALKGMVILTADKIERQEAA